MNPQSQIQVLKLNPIQKSQISKINPKSQILKINPKFQSPSRKFQSSLGFRDLVPTPGLEYFVRNGGNFHDSAVSVHDFSVSICNVVFSAFDFQFCIFFRQIYQNRFVFCSFLRIQNVAIQRPYFKYELDIKYA